MASSSKDRAKAQAQRNRKSASEYRRKLKELRKIGAYEPTSDELTRYRKTQINKQWREYGSFLDDERRPFFFVPADKLTGPERKAFLANARSLSIKTTKTGLFLQREGQRKARLVWDNENKEYDVLLTGKVKWGENRGKKIAHRIPIAPVDRIDRELDRLESKARQMGPLGKGEALSFIVIENGDMTGASRNTYHNPETLRKRLAEYHVENKGHALAFLRLVVVQKTTLTDWNKEHPPRNKRMARRGKKPKGYNGK